MNSADIRVPDSGFERRHRPPRTDLEDITANRSISILLVVMIFFSFIQCLHVAQVFRLGTRSLAVCEYTASPRWFSVVL